MASTLEEMFSHGQSVWLKIAGGAVATPLIVAGGMSRVARRNQDFDLTSINTLGILLGSIVVGAFLGGCLSLKDTVQVRMKAGQHVPLIFKLLLGYGIISLLLWIPLVIGITLVVVLSLFGT